MGFHLEECESKGRDLVGKNALIRTEINNYEKHWLCFSPSKSMPAPPASSPSSLIYRYPIATYRQRPHTSLEPHGVLPILHLPTCFSCFSSALSLVRGLLHSSSFMMSHTCHLPAPTKRIIILVAACTAP